MKPRTQNTVADIERFVSLGYSQSAGNCRVLLDEITRLRQEVKSLKSS
jgi:hypothetical protein